MNTLHEIEANGKVYQRRAWTGGDVPNRNVEHEPEYCALVEAFYQDQIHDTSFDGKLSESKVLSFWECAGTSSAERKAIFINRAKLDAWRTLNPLTL